MKRAIVKQNLSEMEAHQRYGIGLRQLRMLRMANSGPYFIKVSGQIGRPGGRVLYPIKAFDAWLSTLPSGGGRGQS